MRFALRNSNSSSRARARISCTDLSEVAAGSDRRRGIIFPIVLWTITALTIVAASLAFDVQVNSKLAMIQREQFVAYQLARAGIAEGMTHLQNDVLLDYAANPNQMYDSFADVWGQPDRKEKEREVETTRTPVPTCVPAGAVPPCAFGVAERMF